MPEDMQRSIQSTWQKIQQEIPGTEFNYDFWTICQPRRSTYPACRAVIACRMQLPELEQKMLLAIQQAYYLQAKNPSDDDVLIRLAEGLGLNVPQFANDLNSSECHALFDYELGKSRAMYVSSFPSLILTDGTKEQPIQIDYTNKNYILQQIKYKLNT
jgi:putative protein-disulfide isomerase